MLQVTKPCFCWLRIANVIPPKTPPFQQISYGIPKDIRNAWFGDHTERWLYLLLEFVPYPLVN